MVFCIIGLIAKGFTFNPINSMKTSLKSLASAFLLGLLLCTSASATDDTTQKKKFAVVVFPAANASTLWLCLEKYQSEQAVNLQLVNEQGNVLYEEVLLGKRSKKKACRQRFDTSQLPDGTYTFRIVSGIYSENVSFKLATPVVETPSRFIALQ